MIQRQALKTIIFLVVILLGPALLAADQDVSEPREILETQYTLGPGDRIKVTVFGEKDLSGEFQVDGAGNISFPLIGEVRVSGLSLRELEQSLLEKLLDGYLVDPSISLEVLNYRPFYILGEVNKPGKYEYVSGINLFNAVAMAGGYTHRARRNRAEITRTNPEKIIENADHSTVILPGDIIFIRERFF
ncbi:polysaccharide biosynthesis/export family protein [Desulfonatronospira sp.]|uniref:polysaccharide biosynthesis/export family protein n=1 Tax=Desulfonatronospira sp. TaxID=1962951 RepID=UPI0025B8BB85|nr:polysaccharide biosynthesis/export family protein [Desulfonatronospira sp.]